MLNKNLLFTNQKLSKNICRGGNTSDFNHIWSYIALFVAYMTCHIPYVIWIYCHTSDSYICDKSSSANTLLSSWEERERLCLCVCVYDPWACVCVCVRCVYLSGKPLSHGENIPVKARCALKELWETTQTKLSRSRQQLELIPWLMCSLLQNKKG